MREIIRYLPELKLNRIRKNAKRLWKLYINPPHERGIFLTPEKLKPISRRLDVVNTKSQPKQVIFDQKTNQAFVSCLAGSSLQVFDIQNDKLHLKDSIDFKDQCVEVVIAKRKVFVTTTNFERPPHELRNKLWVLDLVSHQIISSTETGGNWSKEIAINPKHDELFVSNWHSGNITVLDIADPQKPSVKQILKWGEAPRGIAYLPEGNQTIVTGFYSGNLGLLEKNTDGSWRTIFTSEPFDKPHYPGNLRHVLITPDGKYALISNLGRNLVHFWDIAKKQFETSVSVGKSPNTISFLKNELLAVSCRDSGYVYFVDLKSKKVIGRSEHTGEEPTGLCEANDDFLVTCFKTNTLELHRLTKS